MPFELGRQKHGRSTTLSFAGGERTSLWEGAPSRRQQTFSHQGQIDDRSQQQRSAERWASSSKSDETLTIIISLLSDFHVTVAQKRQHLPRLAVTIGALAERSI
jgi:hypothetical protein